MTDQSIVDLFWKRDEDALTQTDARYRSYCYAIAFGILGDGEDAKECVNDTYLHAWNSIPPHRPQNLATFLGKITRRVATDRVRYRNADKRGGGELPLILDELEGCLSASTDPEQECEQTELAELIDRFLRSLSANERRVFLCRYWYADSIADIAHEFGYSESKVKSMLHRQRQKLRALLERSDSVKENRYEKI